VGNIRSHNSPASALVILQPHSPGYQQTFDAPAFDLHQLPEVVFRARQILPLDITIQIPPNLVKDDRWLLACIEAGATDLGGIGPKDEVNPDYLHLQVEALKEILGNAGWEFIPRLPVYPQFDDWLSVELQAAVKQWRTVAHRVEKLGNSIP
jgi:7,8-didemethyl-8-hydroxy-5-deazariboflavin synthase